MPVNWTEVAVPLAAGFDTRRTDKRLEPGKLKDLRNAHFDENGTLTKRKGFIGGTISRMPHSGDDQSLVISNLRRLLHHDKELYTESFLQITSSVDDELSASAMLRYTHDNKWVPCSEGGTFVDLEVDPILPAQTTLGSDIAVQDDYVGVARIYGQGSGATPIYVEFILRDEAKQETIAHVTYGGFATATAYKIRVLAFEDEFWLFVELDGTSAVEGFRFPTGTAPEAMFGTITTSDKDFTTDADSECWDVAKIDEDTFGMRRYASGVANVYERRLAASGATTGTPSTGLATVIAGVTMFYGEVDSVTSMWVFMWVSGGGGDISAERWTDDTLTTGPTALSVTAPTVKIFGLSAGKTIIDGDTERLVVIYGDGADVARVSFVDTALATDGGHAMQGLRPYSKVFSPNFSGITSGAPGLIAAAWFVWSAGEDSSQGAYYLLGLHQEATGSARVMRADKAFILGKCFYQYGNAEAIYSFSSAPAVHQAADGSYMTVLERKSTFDTQGAAYTASYNPSSMYLVSVDSSEHVRVSDDRGNGLLSGAVTRYLAANVGELGHHTFPYAEEVQKSGSGSLADGDYLVAFVWEFQDDSGRVHRSAPSVPVSTTVSTGPSAKIEYTVRVPLVGQFRTSTAQHSNIVLAAYRSAVDGSILYRESETYIGDSIAALESSSLDIDVNVGTIADINLTSQDTLYTDSGALSIIAPPPSRFVWASSDRAFACASDENAVWYSRPLVDELPPDFAAELKIATRAKPIAGASLDGSHYIFYEHGIDVFSGQGPNALGQGGFSTTRALPADSGCTDKASVITTEAGVYFKGKKGFYLLGRNTAITPIGLPAEDYKEDTVIQSMSSPDQGKVYWLLGTGTVIVYDEIAGEWSRYVTEDDFGVLGTPRFYGMALYDDAPVLMVCSDTGSHRVCFQDDTEYRDGATSTGENVQMHISTGWIPLADVLAGNNRVRRFALVGDKISDHTLTVRVYYDYSDTVSETFTFDASTLSNGEYLVRARLAKQKASAIRFEIEDSVSAGAESFNLSELVLEVGVRGKIAKMNNANTMTGA